MRELHTARERAVLTRALAVALALTGVVSIWLTSQVFESFALARQTRIEYAHFERLRGSILQLDELLTMSARMAAATGDPRWEARYLEHEPLLDAAIAEALALSPDAELAAQVSHTDAANRKLVALEKSAFDEVRAGRREAAGALLFDAEYERQKAVYAEGMRALMGGLSRRLDAAFDRQQLGLKLSILGASLVLLASVWAWLLFLRRLDRWRVALEAGTAIPEEKLSQDREIAARLRRAAAALAALVAGTGGLVLAGWALDVGWLKSLSPQWVSMKPNTALGLVLAGVALLLGIERQAPGRRRLATAAAAAVALLGLATLSEYLFDVDLGIDELLFDDPEGGVGTFIPGRMSPITAFEFLVAGAGLLLLNRSTRRGRRPAQLAAIGMGAVAVLAVLGYTYGVPWLYAPGSQTPVALHTALAFVALGAALLFARPELGLMRVVVAEGSAGLLVRSLLPAAIALPILLGWLRIAGQRAGLYGTEFGVALFVVATIGLFIMLIGSTVESLSVADAERRRGEAAARRAQFRFARLVESNLLGVLFTDAEGRVLEANDAFLATVGATRDDLAARALWWQVQRAEEGPAERECMRVDGTTVPVVAGAALLDETSGERIAFVLDITEQKRLEERLRQTSKMEAVGRLAGGVAHDFNNLLTVILGYAEVARAGDGDHLVTSEALDEIQRAGERAATLTRQLLGFSRSQVVQPQVLDLNERVREVAGMLSRLIGEDVELRLELAPVLYRTRADPGQIEQIVMNLAVNARDAMPRGGRLTIATANAELDGAEARRVGAPSTGAHAVLSVEDTGCGMSAEVRARIFEPFFTTKERGKGTGLGLATVYGIVERCGGSIQVTSVPGAGTRFDIWLPRTTEEARAPSRTPDGALGGSETVLLVEDEPGLRRLVRSALTELGYQVFEASDAAEASAIAASAGEIDLLLTDVVMPGANGRELAEQLVAGRPALKVLFMSGYTDEVFQQQGVEPGGLQLIAKPFSTSALSKRVRELLDAA